MLKIHFLNVGKGDTCILEFKDTGRIVMVDVNRSSEFEDGAVGAKCGDNIRLTNPVQYLKDINISSIDLFISTHSHMDHLRGLNSIKGYFKNIWLCKNNFTNKIEKFTPSQLEDWNLYLKYQGAIGGFLDGVKISDMREGNREECENRDGIYILSPNDKILELAKEKDNRNIMSTVLLVKYGKCKIILSSDAQIDTWNHVISNYPDEIRDITILKAPYHGREGGYHPEALKLLNSRYTVITSSLNPKDDVIDRYLQNFDNVYPSWQFGNIVFDCYPNGDVVPIVEYGE